MKFDIDKLGGGGDRCITIDSEHPWANGKPHLILHAGIHHDVKEEHKRSWAPLSRSEALVVAGALKAMAEAMQEEEDDDIA